MTGSAVRPATPGGSGNDSVTGPVKPFVRAIVALTSRFVPRLIAPLFGAARASVPGAVFTVTVIAAAGKIAFRFCGLETLAVSVAFLSLTALAATAAFDA